MVQLADLREVLHKLDGPNSELEGKSFSRMGNNQLGLPLPNSTSRSSFHVPIPYAPAAESSSPPSALASACIDALNAGLGNLPKNPEGSDALLFIDFAHLDDSSHENVHWMDLFRSNGGRGKSVIKTLSDLVNDTVPEKYQVIIRFLAGHTGGARKVTDAPGYGKFIADIKRPGTQVHIGYYQPNFLTTKLQPSGIESEKKAVEKLLKTMTSNVGKEASFLQGSLETAINSQLSGTLRPALATISWNHAKLLVINGHTLLTGGANYYTEYADKQGDIVDMQVQLQGDAAIGAHKYCDYFWLYLNQPHDADDASFKVSLICDSHLKATGPGVLNWPSPWSEMAHTPSGEVPMTNYRTGNPLDGVPVLTVGKLGDWLVPNFNFKYPIQFVDAARDLLCNILDQLCLRVPGVLPALKFMPKFINALSDEQLKGNYEGHNVWPAAWASRVARNAAISDAKSTVYISLQALATRDANKQDEFGAVLKGINEKPPFDKNNWDGVLWPIDLFHALGDFLQKTTNGHIQIVISKSKVPDTDPHIGYDDEFTFAQFQEHMKSFCQPPQSTMVFEDWFKSRCEFRRVWANQKFNHSKVICIDHAGAQPLLYVGSDNMYPNYNEEHGVWIEDRTAIGAFVSQYWVPFWEKSRGAPVS